MIKIGEFSKLSRVSVRMLRHYAELGLLLPEKIDSSTGYRYYSTKQLTTINLIRSLQNMGFSLSMVKDILSKFDNPQTLKEIIIDCLQQKEEELTILNKQIALLHYAAKQIERNDFSMEYTVIEKVLPQRQVASMRKKISHFTDEPNLWKIFFSELNKQSVKLQVPPCNVAIYHDEEYSESNQDIEIQSTVIGNYTDIKDLRFMELPSITIASITFKGEFKQIGKVNQTALEWIDKNGYILSNKMFTIYHMDPVKMGENYENWVTEVCYPIEKNCKE